MTTFSSKKHLLVVEDDPKTARALQIRFESAGLAVSLAGDALLGLSLATRIPFDLILLDITMPGGNGLTLARQLQELPKTRGTPVIFLTGSTDPTLRRQAMDLKVAGLCEKPYDAAELMGLVEFALSDLSSFRREPEPISFSDSSVAARAHLKKVLIVEDDQEIARALGFRMKQAGFEPTLAYDALTGFNEALKLQPDLIVLDITMPAGDGFEVAEKIQSRTLKTPPIIFLTASRVPGCRTRAMKLGAGAFFEKPYNPEELMAAAKSLIGSQPSLSQR